MRWNTNTTTMRERSRSASPQPRLQLAVGRRGLGPREQGEQRTQSASFVATYHARVHTEQQLSAVLGSDALLKKKNT